MGLNQRLLVELGVDGVGSEDERRRAADAVAYNVDGRLHRAWLLRQDSCPLGVLWNYYGDAGRGDTQEEMDAYNEFNTYGEFMDNPVAPWFANGDDENGGPDACFDVFYGFIERRVPAGSFYCFFFLFSLLDVY